MAQIQRGTDKCDQDTNLLPFLSHLATMTRKLENFFPLSPSKIYHRRLKKLKLKLLRYKFLQAFNDGFVRFLSRFQTPNKKVTSHQLKEAARPNGTFF